MKFKSRIFENSPTEMFKRLNKKIKKKIENKEELIIGIHVRGGDYLNQKKRFHKIASIGFFKKGINLVNKKFQNNVLRFYVFSDNIDYAYSILNENLPKNTKYYSNSEIEDFIYMLNCDSLIFPNSTFSFMASFFGSSKYSITMHEWYEKKKDLHLTFIPNSYIRI